MRVPTNRASWSSEPWVQKSAGFGRIRAQDLDLGVRAHRLGFSFLDVRPVGFRIKG